MNRTLAFTGAVYTDVGRVRRSNEDNFSLSGQILPDDMRCAKGYLATMSGDDDFVCGVFDGMGGESYGEEASKISALLLDKHKNDMLYGDNNGIKRYITAANDSVCKIISERNSRMGTTVAAAIKSDRGLRFFNIGDSSIYLCRDRKITKLSCDHLVVAQLIACGIITAEEAKTDARRHQLTQHIGIFPDEMLIEAHESEWIEPLADDIFLLCTDGVTDALDERDLSMLMSGNLPADELAKNIADCAMETGSRDNVTAMVLKCHEDEIKTAPEKKNTLKLCLGIVAAMIAGVLANVLLHLI